jgi:hypothetical protein
MKFSCYGHPFALTRPFEQRRIYEGSLTGLLYLRPRLSRYHSLDRALTSSACSAAYCFCWAFRYSRLAAYRSRFFGVVAGPVLVVMGLSLLGTFRSVRRGVQPTALRLLGLEFRQLAFTQITLARLAFQLLSICGLIGLQIPWVSSVYRASPAPRV